MDVFMDVLDLKILNVLRQDARKPFLEVANELGVSDVTIHKRVKKMVDRGVIRGFETVIDDAKLGYGVTAFVEVGVEPGASESAAEKLTRIDGVLETHEIHGHCDILLKVRAEGLSELRDKLVNQIRVVEEVVSTEAFPVMRVVKEEHSLSTTPG